VQLPPPALSDGRSSATVVSGYSPDGKTPLSDAATPLGSILRAQAQGGWIIPLTEIRSGATRSSWMWWIWPALAPVRATDRPRYSLPTVSAFVLLLRHPQLIERLTEITAAACKQLEAGKRPAVLFGNLPGAEQFAECMSCCAIAAAELVSRPEVFEFGGPRPAEIQKEQLSGLFVRAVKALSPEAALDEKVVEVARSEGFDARLAELAAAGLQLPFPAPAVEPPLPKQAPLEGGSAAAPPQLVDRGSSVNFRHVINAGFKDVS